MKKWRNTVLLTLTCAAVAVTARWWVVKLLPLLGIVFKNKETVGTLKDFVQILVGVVTLAIPLFKVASAKKERPQTAHSITKSRVADGNLQTGGLTAQGDISAGGDVVAGHQKIIGGDEIRGDKNTAHGGDVVKGNKYVITQPQRVLTSLHQLPTPPADFTGRTTELAELRAAIDNSGVHISGLQGQGGVGKTVLALKLAAELTPNFPDAQIYLDLKGVSEKPLTAAEAMAHVLHTFHPQAELPKTVEELSPHYNSTLHHKRTLLLMDNAKDASQVQRLIPPPGSMLLVTSRVHFHLPGLQPKNLDTLPSPDAHAFLRRIAPRIKNEAEAIAKLCGYLPLALRLAATTIAERTDLSPADFCEKLADEKHKMGLLGGGAQGVEASITLSYNLLDADSQRRWRMLGIFPDTFDALAGAAAWEIGADTAKEALSHMLKLSMLEWNETNGRYRLHDLMRAFARGKLSTAEIDRAALEHSKHYLGVIGTANDFYAEGAESLRRGLGLFDLEWENIRAGQEWAASHAENHREAAELCSGYPDRGAYILSLRQHPQESIRWSEAGLAAALNLKNREAEARHFGNLSNAYRSLGENRRSIECCERSLAICREFGNRQGEASALGNLGIAYKNLGEYHRAVDYQEAALAIAREIGAPRNECTAIGNLGVAYYRLGEYHRAIEYQEQRLILARKIGERMEEGNSLGNLGLCYGCLGDYRRSIEYVERALAIALEIGDRRGESQALGNLGIAHRNLGDYRRAIEFYEQQLEPHPRSR